MSTTPDDTLPSLLRQTRDAGIYHLPTSGRAALEQATRAAGLAWVACDFGGAPELDAALEKLGRALDFPDWYGNNLDALNDCLTDLSWRDTPETVLVITGCDELRAGVPEGFAALLAVFSGAIDFWKADRHPFWVFIDMRGNGIATLPTIA